MLHVADDDRHDEDRTLLEATRRQSKTTKVQRSKPVSEVRLSSQRSSVSWKASADRPGRDSHGAPRADEARRCKSEHPTLAHAQGTSTRTPTDHAVDERDRALRVGLGPRRFAAHLGHENDRLVCKTTNHHQSRLATCGRRSAGHSQRAAAGNASERETRTTKHPDRTAQHSRSSAGVNKRGWQFQGAKRR